MNQKERMCKTKTKVKYLSNSLKHKALDQDYETIIETTDKAEEKNYKKKERTFIHK